MDRLDVLPARYPFPPDGGRIRPVRNMLTKDQSDFEAGSGWARYGTADTPVRTMDEAWEGSYSLRITTDGTATGQGVWAMPSINVTQGASYTISTYVKGEGHVAIGVSLRTADDMYLTVSRSAGVDLSGTWRRISHQFTVSAPTSKIRPLVVTPSDVPPQAITFYIDGAQLAEGSLRDWVPGGRVAGYESGLPELYYDLQETGRTVIDRSGMGNDGVLSGAVPVAGLAGYVHYFDGIDDNIDCGYVGDFGADRDLTIALWVKPDPDIGSWKAIMGRMTASSSEGYALTMTTEGRARMYLDEVGGSEIRSIGMATDLRGGWHHLVGVVKRDSYVRLFVDGKLSSEDARPSLFNITNPGVTLQIGRVGGGIRFKGFIGQPVILLRRALSTDEVLALYRRDAWRYGREG